MGLDIRTIPEDRVNQIPHALRHRGFSVNVCERAIELDAKRCRELGIEMPTTPFTVTEVECCRGDNRITLMIRPSLKPQHSDILIPNLGCSWKWWRPPDEGLLRFQEEVTSILEEHGAYWPCEGDIGRIQQTDVDPPSPSSNS